MKPKPKNRNILRAFTKLMHSAKAYRVGLLCAIAGLIMTRVSEGIVYKYVVPYTLDSGLIDRDPQFLRDMPMMLIGIFLLIGTGEFLSKYFMGFVGRNVVRDYRQKMLAHLLAVPMQYYKSHTAGTLLSKINYDAEQVAVAVSDAIREFLNSIIAIVVLFSVMLSISWQVTVIVLLVTPLVAYILRVVGKRMRHYTTRVQQTMGDMTNVAAEVISGYQVIKIYQGDSYEMERIRQASDSNLKQELRVFLIAGLSSPIMQLIGGIVLVGFIYLVLSESISLPPGEVFAIIGVLFALIRPLKQISAVNNIFQKGISAIESIHELLETPVEINAGTLAAPTNAHTLEFDNVCFAYPDEPNRNVLQNVSFTIQRGETVAIVGKSGSGKSTLMNLLARFYQTNAGSIMIDGQNIANIELNSLRRNIALMTQNVILFNDTVAKNIAYGIDNCTIDQIRHAANVANALDFIETLPQGFDTIIGENGCLLSGGQRQRLAIARAVIKDAPILIMDEATSALDNQSEQAIKQGLQNLMRDRVTLIIAHRLSTIEQADKIIVMEHGKIVETGTHQSLLNLQGRYALLQQV